MGILAVQAKVMMSKTMSLGVGRTAVNTYEISFENIKDKTW